MLKTVITAAGKGTRLLPATKELPKEMLPIFSRIYGKERIVLPILQLIFEQLYAVNIRDYCFVVGREKRSIEDHFTPDEAYLNGISSKYRKLISNFYKSIKNSHIVWINQNEPLGFGDAVKRTEKFVGNNSFIVHAGDSAIISRTKHPIIRFMEITKKDPSISAVLLCKKVQESKRYGVPKIKKISNSIFLVEEVEEKPLKPKSNFGLLPLYFFKPSIFACLNKIKRGKGNEFQLTDAIQMLIEKGEKVVAIPLNKNAEGLDVGTIESYKQAQDISYKMA